MFIIHFYQDYSINGKVKRTAFYYYIHIINVFTITFDHFIASM